MLTHSLLPSPVQAYRPGVDHDYFRRRHRRGCCQQSVTRIARQAGGQVSDGSSKTNAMLRQVEMCKLGDND
jgi:hypothetical protein